jgi:hypothetical protein
MKDRSIKVLAAILLFFIFPAHSAVALDDDVYPKTIVNSAGRTASIPVPIELKQTNEEEHKMAGEKKSLKMKDVNEALSDFKVRSLEGVTMDGLEKEPDLLGAAQPSKAAYCFDANTALCALNASTGKAVWCDPIGGSALAVAGGMVFTMGSGTMYAFGLGGDAP